MDCRSIINNVLLADHLSGFTDKLVIAGQDIYVKVAFHDGRMVHLDVTLSSMGRGGEIMTTARDATNEATKTDNARAMIELLCRQANELLESGVWDEAALIESWAGTRFEPCGPCRFPQLPDADPDLPWGGIVTSPLDAARRLIEVRLPMWQIRESHRPISSFDTGVRRQTMSG